MEEKTEDIIEVQTDTNIDDESKWCVYCHTNKINYKRYFGITSQDPDERWRNGYGYRGSEVFWRAIQKYGWDGFEHEILFENLTEEEAKKREIELIALYKTNCTKYRNPSYGYNMTDGGDGTVGRMASEQTRRKISNALKGKFVGEDNPNYGNHKLAGENNPNYGKHLEEETKLKISKANKGRLAGDKNPNYKKTFSVETLKKMSESKIGKFVGDKNPNYGRKHTEEECKKMGDANKGINNHSHRPVYSIELNRIFWGPANVKEELGIDSSGVIKCCRGKAKSAGRHPMTGDPLRWVYVYDCTLQDDTIVYGAISLGYTTQKELNNYINNLKQEGTD